MALVERNVQKGPVKIGIGTRDQAPLLYQAGADQVRTHLWLRETALYDDDILFVAFRPEDTVIMVQPNLLSVSEFMKLVPFKPAFLVPGHDPRQLYSERSIRAFRNLEPRGLEVVRDPLNRGARPKHLADMSEAAARWLVDLWHDGQLDEAGSFRATHSLDAVVDKIKERFGEEVPKHVPRDRVKRFTASAARNPADPAKKPFCFAGYS